MLGVQDMLGVQTWISPASSEADVALVRKWCLGWTGEADLLRSTGLGKARLRRALALAGDRLERECRARNTCWARWMYKRHETV